MRTNLPEIGIDVAQVAKTGQKSLETVPVAPLVPSSCNLGADGEVDQILPHCGDGIFCVVRLRVVQALAVRDNLRHDCAVYRGLVNRRPC